MSKSRRLLHSLNSKLALAVLSVILVGGGTFMYYAHQTGYRMLERQAYVRADGIADLLKAMIDHYMLEGKHRRLDRLLRVSLLDTEIKNVMILKKDGTISRSSHSEPGMAVFPMHRLTIMPGEDSGGFFSTKEGDSLYLFMAAPLDNLPSCYGCHKDPETVQGYFAVKVMMNDLKDISKQHRDTNIAMTTLTFSGVGLVMFLAISLLIVRPIRHIQLHLRHIESEVQSIEPGTSPQLAKLTLFSGTSEIVELTSGFNDLISRLNTANRQVEEMHKTELQQADHLATAGEMAASIAHEIKNPLAGILGAIQVLDSEIPAGDSRKEVMEEIVVQLERMNHAVNDLLSYARPSPPLFEDVNIQEIIEKTLSLLSHQVRGGRITIVREFLAEPVKVRADRKMIQQLVWNIALNGIQAMESGGVLTVSMTRQPSILLIEIRDTGRGIPEEHRARVFKPFFTTKHKGTGLGLAISRRIAEQHHGTLELKRIVDEGTVVLIQLPI
jgi:signal transduction histidine kinase